MAAKRLRRRRRRRRPGRRRHRLGPGARGLPRRRARRGRPRRARLAAATSRWSGCRARAWASRAYAGWTIRSSEAWGGFAAALKQETGLDVSFQRPGGFHLALSETELEARASILKRLHNQPGIVELQDRDPRPRARSRRCCPTSGPRWSGGSYCPLDGHVNSLRLFRTLHTAINARGVDYLPSHRVESDRARTAASSGSRRRRARCAPARSCSPPATPTCGWRRWSGSRRR